MLCNFYDYMAELKREYEDAQWDVDSGKSPSLMEEEMQLYYAENAKRPYPIVFAELFKYVLDNGMIDINVHTPFPDKICNGVPYTDVAHAGIFEKISTKHYMDTLEKRIPSVRSMRLLARCTGVAIPDLDVWHAIFDWPQIIDNGFSGLYQRVFTERKKKEDDGTLTEKQEIFYESARIALEGVINYLKRLSCAAEKKGMQEAASAYGALTQRPPQSLYELLCLQRVAMTAGELARERIRSLGLIDKLWTPFYVKDIESGKMTKEEIREMLRYFLIKIVAEKRYANQPLAIGTDWSADSPECELVLLFLDTYQELKIESPKLQIRCSKDMPEVVLRKLMEMTRGGSSSIILYNDEAIIKAYGKIGIPREEAENYLPMGCNETCIPGVEEMHICSAWINLAKAVEYAITGGEDNLQKIYLFGRSEEPKTWEEFLDIYYDYLHRFAEFTLDNINKQAIYSYESNPAPFLSSTFKSCVEKGRDAFDRGLPRANESVKIFALGSAVDSLLAVKKFVYETGEVTLAELAQILRNNWRGYEELRQKIRKDPVKWGNGEPEADKLAADIYAYMGREINGKPTAGGGVFRMGGDSVNMAERYGHFTGATPDGRKAREPMSKNIRPSNGCEHRGISGLIKSFAAVDFTDAVDGAPLDFMIHPTAVEGEEGLEFLCSIIKIFFKNEGINIQGNVVDIDTLLKAKGKPEDYPDLQVRVCGWNEYFVNMHPIVQSDFIKRASGGLYE